MLLRKEPLFIAWLENQSQGRDFLGSSSGTEPNLLPLHHFMSGINGKRCLIPWQRGLICSTSLEHEIELLRRS